MRIRKLDFYSKSNRKQEVIDNFMQRSNPIYFLFDRTWILEKDSRQRKEGDKLGSRQCSH